MSFRALSSKELLTDQSRPLWRITVSKNIDRRTFLAGTTAGSLVLLTLGGCKPGDDKKAANTAVQTAVAAESGSVQPHPVYGMVFDQNKCIGCGECKDACNEANNLPPGISRLLLERQTTHIPGTTCPICGGPGDCDCERVYVRVSCQQCQDAPCVRVCPTGAAHRDPKTNIVTMDPDHCVGCKYCIAACPYNVRFINSQTKVADNCNFCLDTRLSKGLEPACVNACRHGALYFGDLNDPQSIISRLLRVKDTVRIRAHLGTDPNLRYVPVTKQGV